MHALKILAMSALLLIVSCEKKVPSATAANPPAPPAPPAPPPAPKLSAAYNWPPAIEEAVEMVPDAQRTDKNFYVVLDGSGSMRESKCAENGSKSQVAVDALQKFIKEIPKDANLGLLIFDEKGISERVPLGKDNRPAFVAAMKAMDVGKGTPLLDAISKGKGYLEKQARRQAGYGEYTMIIVTDGESDSGQNPKSVVDTLVSDTPISIHTLGFCIGNDHSLNQPNRVAYKSADSFQELLSGLKDVLAESTDFQVTEFK